MATETESQVTTDVTPGQTPAPPEETVESLKVELAKERADRQRFEANFKTLQGTHNKTAKELQDARNLADRIERLEQTSKLSYAQLAKKFAIQNNDDLTPEERKSQLQEADKIIQQEQAKTEQDTYTKWANGVYAEAVKLGGEDSDLVEKIELALSTGNKARAEKYLDKLKDAKGEAVTETKTDKVKTEAEIEKEIRAKVEAELLVKYKANGLLDSGPAANKASRSFTRQEIDTMPAEEFASKRLEIMEAQRLGRVK